MRRCITRAFVLGAALGASALSSFADDYWDPSTYKTITPNEKASASVMFVGPLVTCGFGVADSFDSCAWTLHQSNALRIFRSTPPSGFLFQVR